MEWGQGARKGSEPRWRVESRLRRPVRNLIKFEKRFTSIGMGALGRLLVALYAYRGENIRIISARLAAPHERAAYEAGLQ